MKNQAEKMAMTARTYITIGPLVVLVLWIVVGASLWKVVELVHRSGVEASIDNENVADTIYAVLFIMQKEMAGMGGLTEELLKEFVDEFYIFYTLRLAKGLNSIESVSGNVTIDNIKESKRELVAMFQSYGYTI